MSWQNTQYLFHFPFWVHMISFFIFSKPIDEPQQQRIYDNGTIKTDNDVIASKKGNLPDRREFPGKHFEQYIVMWTECVKRHVLYDYRLIFCTLDVLCQNKAKVFCLRLKQNKKTLWFFWNRRKISTFCESSVFSIKEIINIIIWRWTLSCNNYPKKDSILCQKQKSAKILPHGSGNLYRVNYCRYCTRKKYGNKSQVHQLHM